jgi:hypothetical protein
VEELQHRLAEFCAAHGIERFSPAEIIELLEDGEEVGWIVEQVAAGSDASGQLARLLTEIAAETAPSTEATAPSPEGESPLREDVGFPGREAAVAAEARDEIATAPADEAGAPPMPGTTAGDLQAGSLADLDALKDIQLPEGIDRGQVEQLLSSPQGALLADFGLFCQEKGVSPDEAAAMGKKEGGPLAELREEWLTTPRASLDGRRPADLLEEGGMFGKVGTYRREVPKTGRNDPCPCASGKKYKRCCGRGD